MLNRMDRMILSEIVGPFVGSVFLFTSLILASGELIRFAEYLQGGESVLLVAQLLAYTLPSIFSLTFPIAMLLAALLSFNRLSGDSEMVALVAAGISFERIMLSVGLFGLLVSFVGIWFTNSVVPRANAGRQNIIDTVAQRGHISFAQNAFDRTVRNTATGDVLQLHAEGGISLGERRSNSATIHNLTIELWQKGSLQSIVYASRADWEIGTQNWMLNGTVYGADFTQTSESTGTIFHLNRLQTLEQPLGKPDELQALQEVRVEDVSTRDLRKRSKLFRQSGDISDARDADVESARRIALPFASLVFALLGAPLGVRPPRAGRGMGFGLAILLTFAYWTLLQLFTVVGRGGAIPAWLAVSIPNLLGLGLAAYLIHQKSRGQS